MSTEQIHIQAQALLAQAGITVPETRLHAVALGVAAATAQVQAFARYDFALTEPASRFRAPK